MTASGRINSLWRYPVKSMRGEELEEAFVGFAGIYGDRLYAFKSSVSPKGLPFFTAREQTQMLRYQPRFRHPDNLVVDVVTPSGTVLAIDDPALIPMLVEGAGDVHQLTLIRSDQAMTDCHPISLFSIQTAQALGDELGIGIDKRRFRANIYLDLGAADGFVEDEFVGRTMRIGSEVVISILERDPRCKIITLDPETGESNPQILRSVAQSHEGKAGVYAAVQVEGVVRRGDEVTVLT